LRAARPPRDAGRAAAASARRTAELPVAGFSSIRSRILAFALVATFVPSLGLGLLVHWHYEALVRDNVAVELRTLGNHARSELRLWLVDRASDARAVSAAATIVDGLSTAERSRTGHAGTGRTGSGPAPSSAQRMGIYLSSVLRRLDSMLELTVVDARGQAVASTATSPRPVPLPASWADGMAHDAVFQLPPRQESAGARATTTLVVPILSPGDELLGALAAVVDLERLRPRLERIAAASAAEIVLATPDGMPVLGSREDAAAVAPIARESLSDLLAHPGEPSTYAGHRGERVIGIATRSDASPLVVVVERSNAEVYGQLRRLFGLFAALTAGLTLIVAFAAYRVARSIVVPLDGFVRAVDRVAAGSLDVHLHAGTASEIARLTQALNTMAERLRRGRDDIENANAALQRQNELLEEMSVTDALTGLDNRKRLAETLASQMALYRRHQRRFAVIMLDIDHFKRLNDTYGHLAGDRVLQRIAEVIKASVRSVDRVARYGGEEFVVVLAEATMWGALETAERIRCAVQNCVITQDGRPLSVTVSLGVALCREDDARAEDLIARADAALYEAKRAGRNRIQSEARTPVAAEEAAG